MKLDGASKFPFELPQLEAFRLVLELGTVTKAAENLGVSQPAVTKTIRRLENSLGFKLFQHRRGTTVPTHEAVLFYEAAKLTLAGASRLSERAEEIAESREGSIHVISNPLGAMIILPGAIADFRRDHPGVTFRVQTANSPQIQEFAQTQAFDIGLAEPPIDKRNLRTTVHSLRCLCAMPEDHPLSAAGLVTLRELAKYPLVLSAQHRPFHQSLRQLFARHGMPWNSAVEVDMGAMELELIRGGVGVGVVDELSASRTTGIVTRPLRPAPRYEICVFQPNRQLPAIVSEFAKVLRAKCRVP